jgi:glyoxylase-like metal-dependent hydrolase (beta-lactamase superfamily II)
MTALVPDFTAEPTATAGSPLVYAFFDAATSTWTYIAVDPSTKDAVIIDSVLGYDPASGKVDTSSTQGLAAFVKQKEYRVIRIMETHVHADHATGAHALKQVRLFSDLLCTS